MQVEGCATVNKDQRAEEKRQPVIANAPKYRGKKRSGVENNKLHDQSHQPEERNNRADRAGEWTGCGEFTRSKKRQRSKRNDDEHNEAAVNPEKPAEKRMKRCKIRAPVQNSWSQRARDQNYEVQTTADDQPSFHSAPIACINGMITRLTKCGWKSQYAGPATTSIVKRQTRKIANRRFARTDRPCRRKEPDGK